VPELKLAELTCVEAGVTDPENDTEGLVQALPVALPFGLLVKETLWEKPVDWVSRINNNVIADATKVAYFNLGFIVLELAAASDASVVNEACTGCFIVELLFDDKISFGRCGRRRLCKTEQPSGKIPEGIIFFFEIRRGSPAVKRCKIPEIYFGLTIQVSSPLRPGEG
jgi:hypothetical protein